MSSTSFSGADPPGEQRRSVPHQSSAYRAGRSQSAAPKLRISRGAKAGTIFLMHECPLCGEMMRLSVRDVLERNGDVRQVREWICPEFDYFEEGETEG